MEILHLRNRYRDPQGNLKPTAKGVTIPHDQIKPLRKALRKGAEELNNEAMAEAQPVKVNKKPKREKKSGWGASSKSEKSKGKQRLRSHKAVSIVPQPTAIMPKAFVGLPR
jgi:hypothetical protein